MASGTALTFTKAAVGTGFLPSGYDPGSMQELNAFAMEGAISSCSCEGDEASVVFQVSSMGVETGFTVTEAGLYASDPDEGEILYAYLDMKTDPQYVYPENAEISKFIEFTLVVKVGTVDSVTAYISPKSLVTRKDFDEAMGKKVDASGGDVADTIVSEFTTITDQFPIPAPGENQRTFWGKVKKFGEDFKNWCKGVCLIGSIVNNCTSEADNLPLAARQGKVLMDLYTQLYSEIVKFKIQTYIIVTELANPLHESGFSNYIGELDLSTTNDMPANLIVTIPLGVWYGTSASRLGIVSISDDKIVRICTHINGSYRVRVGYVYY